MKRKRVGLIGCLLVLALLPVAQAWQPHNYDTPFPDGDLSDWKIYQRVITDPRDDSLLSGVEMRDISVTWDADFLYVSAIYDQNTSNSIQTLIYLDVLPDPGFVGGYWGGIGGVVPGSLCFSPPYSPDFVIERTDGNHLRTLYVDNSMKEYDLNLSVTGSTSGTPPASNCTIECAIPWNTLYGLGPELVSPGATLGVAGGMCYTGWRALDVAAPLAEYGIPNSTWFLIYEMAKVTIDGDNDGLPDRCVTPLITRIQHEGTGSELSFSNLTLNASYEVDRSTNLSSTNWESAATFDLLGATNEVPVVIKTVGDDGKGTSFFRLRGTF